MGDIVGKLAELVGTEHVLVGERLHDDYTHDEALTTGPVVPLAVVRPSSTDEVAAILTLAEAERLSVVARGSGTGLSGGCRPVAEGIVVAFDRMDMILEIDTLNHAAVVQPGVTLEQLDAALGPLGLVYPVFPGESSASLGGNVGTNAGGMRAIRYGVTRHHVLGLEAVLAGGQVIRTGGKIVKSATGYDLTQLLIGSEGTLALITEATLKLEPRLPHTATVLAPFGTLEEVTQAVPRIVASGAAPLILEYLDMLTMASITASAAIDLGIPQKIRDTALAYLVVVLESTHADRIDADVEALGMLLAELGALDVYVLPPSAGAGLVAAREKAFFVAKAAGADDIIDAVVPRAAIPEYLATVATLAGEHGALVAGCGHVGDGNVHLSVFQPDAERRGALLHAIFEAAVAAGGAISGEHGIGSEKQRYFLELEDPVKVELMRRIKVAFDPHGILGPGRLLDAVRPPPPTPPVVAGEPSREKRRADPMNGAQSLIKTLADAEVDVCFANPGTSEMHFVAALDHVPEMRGVLCLFEGVATGAADGYARVAGRPAATLLHLGPGLGNGLANLHNARRAHTPLVNIVGDHATYHKRFDVPLESDVASLAGAVSGWYRMSMRAEDVGADAADAVAAAYGPPGCVATLVLPADVSWSESAGGPARPRLRPLPGLVPPTTIDAVAKVLRSGEPAALLVGGTAVRQRGLVAASRVANATGAKMLGETFPANLERGAGLPELERLGYFAEFVDMQLAGMRHLVLAGTQAPVSFFAYPGKASYLVPDGCEVHVLAGFEHDAPAALEALADAVGAPADGATLAAAHRPDRPTGALNMETLAAAVGALLPEDAVVVDEANTSGLFIPGATAGAPPTTG